jgi:hemoglobin
MKKHEDITDITAVKLLVNTFYAKVRQDDLLADIFNEIIKDRWEEHMDKMYRFWQTVLLKKQTYCGSPFSPHETYP